jgi:CheY-like chemotaxis protein
MIVDVFMPNMRGFESVRLFHRRAPSVPLVAISGYAISNVETSGADFPVANSLSEPHRDAIAKDGMTAEALRR